MHLPHQACLLALTLAALTGCSFGDDPPAAVAITYLEANSRILTGRYNYKVESAKVSNCSGDANRKTCIVSHTAIFDDTTADGAFGLKTVRARGNAEGEMDFVKSPSGWNARQYRAMK